MSLACSDVWFETPERTIRRSQARWAPSLRPLKQDVVGDVGRTLWVLMGTIAIVLLMACANVANLLLVRGGRTPAGVRDSRGAGRALDASGARSSWSRA